MEPDRLVLLALGEAVTDEAERTHVDHCPACQADVTALREVAGLGRETQGLSRQLPAPPPRVWRQIAAAVEADTRLTAPVQQPTRRYAGRRGRTQAYPGGDRAWRRTALVAVAAAAVGVAATLGVVRALDQPAPQSQVTASAALTAMAGAPGGARGEARVLDSRGDGGGTGGVGGGERLHLHLTGLPLRPGYYEVWLINPDTGKMISVGVVGEGTDALLPLPATVDLREYRLVDVSAEEYDGEPAHSGRSMLRGTLTS
ncbi:MAG TPA: anti-sigma factor [Micromonosporaceae bacterium]|nr:anti-sigma factor [Micromonosporaceae bacterium]